MTLSSIGIPKEIKIFENRVGMTPKGVRQMVQSGLRVLVEKGAGVGSGFLDKDYRDAGAVILSSKKEVYRKSDLIMKVKEPQPSEYAFFRPGLVIFAYFHLAAEPQLLKALVKKKVTALAFETIEVEGRLPLLAPMSQIAGSLAALIGANYLRKDLGGKGLLLNAIGSGRSGRVFVLGAGNVGMKSIQLSHGLGAHVAVLDQNEDRLSTLKIQYPERLETYTDSQLIPGLVGESDLVIGAVLIPGQRAPHLVTKKMVSQMSPGSVVVDVAVDQGGCIETIHPTTLKNPVYRKYEVIHYGVTNIPALVPHTATEALAEATLPFALKIAQSGIEKVRQDTILKTSVNTFSGDIIHPALSVPGTKLRS
ncbi:MAG: alanine dehydrogenase [Deltaproteobacteria bacterium]|nr:MAG: alanine dehydrogenase [Deltaproteobacteria bacterium]